MRQSAPAVHTSHKLLLTLLLLVAFGAPFMIAGIGGDIDHATLTAGSGIFGGSQASQTTASRHTNHAATISTVAGQSLVGATVNRHTQPQR